MNVNAAIRLTCLLKTYTLTSEQIVLLLTAAAGQPLTPEQVQFLLKTFVADSKQTRVMEASETR
jgi:hypothetical protein